jgi:hypothetical protein
MNTEDNREAKTKEINISCRTLQLSGCEHAVEIEYSRGWFWSHLFFPFFGARSYQMLHQHIIAYHIIALVGLTDE